MQSEKKFRVNQKLYGKLVKFRQHRGLRHKEPPKNRKFTVVLIFLKKSEKNLSQIFENFVNFTNEIFDEIIGKFFQLWVAPSSLLYNNPYFPLRAQKMKILSKNLHFSEVFFIIFLIFNNFNANFGKFPQISGLRPNFVSTPKHLPYPLNQKILYAF